MIALDEESLICDLAEVYRIYDMRSFPCSYIAILASGLRDNSRIKIKASGLEVDLDRLLLDHIADSSRYNLWAKTEDGQKGRNRPKSFVELLTEKIDESKLPIGFNSSEDFEKAWRDING